MEVNDLFYPNYYAKTKITTNQGGTWSAKTYTILQVLHQLACEKKRVITVAGQDVPNLKKGAIRDFFRILTDPEQEAYLKGGDINEAYNKSDRVLNYESGSIIEFSSFKDEQDARSGKRDILFINEANGISYEIFWQLFMRTEERVYLDYNPSAKFWVHDKILPRTDCTLIISDHRRNKFISEEMHREIESIDDKELFKVYARGLTGKVRGLIYPNYQLCDSVHEYAKISYGLDFGFNHAMALVQTGKFENRIYWHEMIYQTEMTIGDLIHQMKELGIGRSLLYCDNARPDAIEDLKRAGFNAKPADKSVKDGIDYVKRHQLFITRSSTNLIKEVGRYKWKEDRNGITLEEPVKFLDDGMDAGRYGSYTARKGGNVVISSSNGVADILEQLY